MDEICLEMKRIGNNINQLARYVNIHKEEVNQEVLNEVEKKMADYVIMQDKLNVTWRKLMSIKYICIYNIYIYNFSDKDSVIYFFSLKFFVSFSLYT